MNKIDKLATIRLSGVDVEPLIDSETFEDLLIELEARWGEEHKYEDLREYAIPIEKYLNKRFNTEYFTHRLRMIESPFGFTVVVLYSYKDSNGCYSGYLRSRLTVSLSYDGLEWKVSTKL